MSACPSQTLRFHVTSYEMPFSNSDTFLFSLAVVLIPAGFICYLYLRLFSARSLPDVLPWVGVDGNGGLFSRARATLRSVTNTREMLQEGHYKVNPQ